MNCKFKFTGKMSGKKYVHVCTECEREVASGMKEPMLKAVCKVPGTPEVRLAPPPATGPGTELAALLKEYGIRPRKSCGCGSWIARMNAWGPAGCAEHREEILAHLKAAYDMTPFWERTKAAALAILKGLPTSLEGAVDEAVIRAKREAEKAIADADEYLGGQQ